MMISHFDETIMQAKTAGSLLDLISEITIACIIAAALLLILSSTLDIKNDAPVIILTLIETIVFCVINRYLRNNYNNKQHHEKTT